MAIQKLPSGSRGVRTPPGVVARVMVPVMVRVHRMTGNRFNGMKLLYLTTVGARSGQRRTAPVARFEHPDGGWIVVASAGGAATHPGWYHNIAAHPDQVWADVDGVTQRVEVEQLSGVQRDEAWTQVVARSPGFRGYTEKTDRELPVLHLIPADD